MFVENERVFNFKPVANKTLEEIKDECFNDFFSNLKEYVFQPCEVYPKELNKSISQYEYFKNIYGKNISFNTKNRQFSQLFTDLKIFISDRLRNSQAMIGRDGKNTVFKDYKVIKVDDSWDGYRGLDENGKKLFYEHDFLELFGVGEFPFVLISITRIGNHDYYFYTITR